MLFKIQFLVFIFILLNFISSFSQDYDTLFLKPGPNEGKDVILRSVYANINEGNHHDFMAATWTLEQVPFTNRSLLEFDLSSIPETATIIEARLSLFYSEQTNGIGNSGENESYLLKIIEEWGEHTVTWDSQPSVSYENPVYLPASNSQFQDYLDIDVTDLISDLYNYPNLYHGFMFRLIDEEIYRSMTFASSDQLNPQRWPELQVVYIECDQPIPEFTYNIDEDLNVVFNNLSQNYDSCFWNFGNGYYSSEVNPTIQYYEEGIYFVELTVFNYCDQNSITDTICYFQDLINTFEYEINDKEVSFVSLAEEAISYAWDFGDGFMSNLENPVHTFNDYADYYVCLTVEHFCDETVYCDTVKIIFPDAIAESLSHTISVYPNPFYNKIRINNSSSIDYSLMKIRLNDYKGLTVFSKIINLNSLFDFEIQLDDLDAGIYTLVFHSEELVIVKKLIKL